MHIAALRTRLGLTQVQLAELTGVHPITVSKWERGVLRPVRGLPVPFQLDLVWPRDNDSNVLAEFVKCARSVRCAPRPTRIAVGGFALRRTYPWRRRRERNRGVEGCASDSVRCCRAYRGGSVSEIMLVPQRADGGGPHVDSRRALRIVKERPRASKGKLPRMLARWG